VDRAVKEGRGRHNEYLYPAMPYTAYVKISDQDVRDIKACLDTVPAVHDPVVSNPLPFQMSAAADGQPVMEQDLWACWRSLRLHRCR
jgi:hypothetical protein